MAMLLKDNTKLQALRSELSPKEAPRLTAEQRKVQRRARKFAANDAAYRSALGIPQGTQLPSELGTIIISGPRSYRRKTRL